MYYKIFLKPNTIQQKEELLLRELKSIVLENNLNNKLRIEKAQKTILIELDDVLIDKKNNNINKESITWINFLYENNYKIILITDRKIKDEDAVFKILEQNNVLYDNIYFDADVGYYISKKSIEFNTWENILEKIDKL